jgi:fibronectin type 3 domain-containing protein
MLSQFDGTPTLLTVRYSRFSPFESVCYKKRVPISKHRLQAVMEIPEEAQKFLSHQFDDKDFAGNKQSVEGVTCENHHLRCENSETYDVDGEPHPHEFP